jgi:hypothetical protein
LGVGLTCERVVSDVKEGERGSYKQCRKAAPFPSGRRQTYPSPTPQNPRPANRVTEYSYFVLARTKVNVVGMRHSAALSKTPSISLSYYIQAL